MTVRRLVAGTRRLGALALRHAAPPGADALLAFGTVANILAPELSRAEQMRHLEGEVERRTRQLDDEKRFTEQIVPGKQRRNASLLDWRGRFIANVGKRCEQRRRKLE